MTRQYKASMEELEKKLARVMDRLGVKDNCYQSDWSNSKSGASCSVEMMYNGRVYRFANDTAKSAACGRDLTRPVDLFAAVVYSLEGIARAVEQGIFSLDMLLEGKLALPEGKPLEPCFAALGFASRPASAEDVSKRYRDLSKVLHPDKGGDPEAFMLLKDNYHRCMELMEASGTGRSGIG